MFPFNFFYSLQITENIGTTRAFDFKPIIWVDAGIHAREWISIAVAMKFIKRVRLRLVETGKNTQPTKCLRGLQSVCVCLVHKVAMSVRRVFTSACVFGPQSLHVQFTKCLLAQMIIPYPGCRKMIWSVLLPLVLLINSFHTQLVNRVKIIPCLQVMGKYL